MYYSYYNQFNLSNELANAISSIISQKENGNYICKILDVEIAEHEGLTFKSPLDGYNAWGGGLNALSGAQINEINEKYGKYVYDTIPAEEYSYLIVVDVETYEFMSKISFESKKNLEKNLKNLCSLYIEYDGIFNAEILVRKFPYLEDFFNILNVWRAETGRVTLDKNILKSCTNKALSNGARKLKK